MSFCLPKELTSKFIQAIKEGTIVPEKLITMSSAERRAFFEDIVGKGHAKDVNALLESKLLLKDQKRGMVSWAKKVSGISEAARRDMISRIEKMQNVLDPTSQQSFLADLASTKLGTDITMEEAKNVASFSRKVTEARAKLTDTIPDGSPERIDYGAKYIALQNYVHELKLSNSKFSLEGLKEDFKQEPGATIARGIGQVAGTAKSFKASFDDSFYGRQAFRTVFTNPVLWGKNFLKSFGDIRRQLGKKGTDNSVVDGIKAEVYSRKNAMNGLYGKMKLDIGLTSEEAFPSTLPEHIPVLGRLYKAAEVAFNGAGIRLRADIADRALEIAERNGVDLADEFEVRSLGKLINSLTGRGDLGRANQVADIINVPFFSPRMLKSQFDFLTLHMADKMSWYSRKQAAFNTLKVVAGVSTILAIANALMPGSVETDPRSSDFGQIKIGSTRFDLSGGIHSMITLAARFATGSTKTNGTVKQLNTGKFGSQTTMDVLWKFVEGKFSPGATALKELATQTDYNGNKLTAWQLVQDLFAPLPATNIQELMSTPNAAPLIVGALADFAGISTNSYAPSHPKNVK
jgi:hypothetical protein